MSSQPQPGPIATPILSVHKTFDDTQIIVECIAGIGQRVQGIGLDDCLTQTTPSGRRALRIERNRVGSS